jgi:hypothetical protein
LKLLIRTMKAASCLQFALLFLYATVGMSDDA